MGKEVGPVTGVYLEHVIQLADPDSFIGFPVMSTNTDLILSVPVSALATMQC
jgi:hypothetical protein